MFKPVTISPEIQGISRIEKTTVCSRRWKIYGDPLEIFVTREECADTLFPKETWGWVRDDIPYLVETSLHLRDGSGDEPFVLVDEKSHLPLIDKREVEYQIGSSFRLRKVEYFYPRLFTASDKIYGVEVWNGGSPTLKFLANNSGPLCWSEFAYPTGLREESTWRIVDPVIFT